MLYGYLQGVEMEVEAVTTHVVAITGNPELEVEPEGTLTGITSQEMRLRSCFLGWAKEWSGDSICSLQKCCDPYWDVLEGLGYYRSTVDKATTRLGSPALTASRSAMPIKCGQTAVYPKEKNHPVHSSHYPDLPATINIEGKLTTSKKIRPLRKLRWSLAVFSNKRHSAFQTVLLSS